MSTMHAMPTLSEELEIAKAQGYLCNFTVENGNLRCIETDERFRPSEATIVDHRRFEGASSEEDKEVLYFIETSNGRRGTLVDAYGTYASERVNEFLRPVRVCED